MRTTPLFALSFSVLILLSSTARAAEIRPEMIVTVPDRTIACFTIPSLLQMYVHARRGELTKANSLMMDNGGDCQMLPLKSEFKVLSVRHSDEERKAGLVEIIDKGAPGAHGAWVFLEGVKPVLKKK